MIWVGRWDLRSRRPTSECRASVILRNPRPTARHGKDIPLVPAFAVDKAPHDMDKPASRPGFRAGFRYRLACPESEGPLIRPKQGALFAGGFPLGGRNARGSGDRRTR